MRWQTSSFSAVAASIIYVVFTLLAYLHYADAFSPMSNWLSDLGNPQVNQSGALLYNTGCILASVGLLVFFLGLGRWITADGRVRTLVRIAQISGVASSIALIITALFPLGPQTAVHSLAGKIHVIFLGFFLTFSATVFLKRRSSVKWPAYLGFLSAIVNFIYGAFLYSTFVAEWAAIGMFIVYVLVAALAFRELPSERQARQAQAAKFV